MRNKWKGNTGDGNESDSSCELQGNEKDRQPRLTNLTPEYDLKLFMEAQAIASEKIEKRIERIRLRWRREKWWRHASHRDGKMGDGGMVPKSISGGV